MGIIDLLKGRRAADAQTVTGMFRMGRQSYSATSWGFTRVTNSIYGNPTGKRCIDYLETSYSRPGWVIYKKGTKERIDNHPLLNILNSPDAVLQPKGGAMSGTMFQRTIIQNKILTGRSFWLKLRGADGQAPIGKTTGLRRLAPQRVTVIGNDDDDLIGFIYQDRRGGRQPLLPEDVLYFRYPHPDRYYDGFAPALVAGLPAETDNLAQRFNYDLLANDGAVPAVIIVQGLTPDKFKSFKAEWEAGENPGKTRFIGGDQAQFIKVGQSNKELAYDKLRDYSKHDIANALGVAFVLIEPTDATFANMSEAKANFIQDRIAPDWILDADEITAQLGPEFGVDIGFDLSVVDELQEAADAVVDREIKLIGVQASTPNKLLELLGRDKVAWGDKPILPVSPLKPAEPQPPGTTPSGEPSTAALETIEDAQDYRDKLMHLFDAAIPTRETAAYDPKKARTAFDKRVAAYEPRAERKMAAFFKRQGRVVAARIGHDKGKAAATALRRFLAADDNDIIDRDRWDGELADDVSDVLGDVVDSFGTAAASDLASIAFDSNAAAVKAYITKRSTDVAKIVNDTTESELRAMLADLESQGLGIDEMARQVRGYFDDSDGRAANRATTFARTEVIGAGNFASVQAAAQSGVVKGKTWLAAGDCNEPDCLDLDGETVGMDESFSSGDDFPPAHPNCRCTVTYELLDGTTEEDDSNDEG